MVFAWIACMNGLPTMLNLTTRGVNSSGFCPLCDKAIENLPHAFLHCDHAKQTWSLWQDCLVNLVSSILDPTDIALNLLEKGTTNDLEIFFPMA
mgnify:CR=1 FL=1